MPEKDGKRDTQHTEQGYEIRVPKRGDVFDVLDKAAKKTDRPREKKSLQRRTRKQA